MSFQEMKESLVNAYDRNVAIIRMKQLINDGHAIIADAPGKLKIPVLSGATGIGKTACVEELAAEMEFELIELDCSYMPSSHLATFMYSAVNRIRAGKINGCVLLIDNINEADDEWLELFDQYANNYFDALVKMASDENQDCIRKTRQRVDDLPEGLFIVGEQRPGQSIVASLPNNYGTWEELVDAVRYEPHREQLNEFLTQQVSLSFRQQIIKWFKQR